MESTEAEHKAYIQSKETLEVKATRLEYENREIHTQIKQKHGL